MKSEFNLLPFQNEAVIKTIEAINRYNGSKNLFTSSKKLQDLPVSLVGKPKPYLHRIKAITGAGKTPILASISAHLKNSIIIWTTPRGAIIEQTTTNLKNKYRNLLNSDTEVLSLDESLKQASWNRLVEQETGISIITTTVAAFNQKENNNLNIHKGDPSPWNQLCKEVNRPIWIFYDEGHNATENQFLRLLELEPKGFILASASPLAEDLYILLPGEDIESKKDELINNRTTIIDTKQVVSAGLLKHTIEIHDLNTGENKILEQAYKKRQHLEKLSGQNVIACYIVDKDSDGIGILHGLDIWQKLVDAGADPKTIAVHLSNAEKAKKQKITEGALQFNNLIPTYDKNFGPDDLRASGFKHIIWNLSLQEGWDEPWAYVGYFHGQQSSESKIIQRIGRLIRNPFKNEEGFPELSLISDLRSVYCYLNTTNEVLKQVVDKLQADMDTSGLEILVVKESKEDNESISIDPKLHKTIPNLYITPDSKRIEAELEKALFSQADLAKNSYKSEGKEITLKMVVGESKGIKINEKKLKENAPTTIGDIVKNHLRVKDRRLIGIRGSSEGAWIHPFFWHKERLQREINYSSKAYDEYIKRCNEFINKLHTLISVEQATEDVYLVDSVNLINPGGGDTLKKREFYKTHAFKNALHPQYNCLNDFELKVAQTLDEIGIIWARNPAKKGYGIPLLQPENSSTKFYPDFIAWHKDQVFFIESKGAHLLEQTKKNKLTKLPKGMNLGIITHEEGKYKLYIKDSRENTHCETGALKKVVSDFIQT